MRFQILIDDLQMTPDAELRAREVSEIARWTWFLLKHGRSIDTHLNLLREWEREYRALCQMPGAARALHLFLSYIHQVQSPENLDAIREALESMTDPDSPERAMTTKRFISSADHLREEGRLEAGRAFLCKLLARRFGVLAPVYHQRIQTADTATLERWTDRVLEAARLEDVFGE